MTFGTRVWRAVTAVLVAATPLLAAAPTATAATITRLSGPTNLHAVSISDRDIVLAWNRSGSGSYDLFFDNNPTPFLVSGTTFDVQTNVAIGMIPGSTHTFQVRAADGGSLSNKLTASFAPGDDTPPTEPTNLHVVRNDSNGIVLGWDPSVDQSSVIYFVDGAPCSPHHAGSATSILIGSLVTDPVCGIGPGTYTFSVRAQDDIGFNSPSSAPISVTFTG
jgi:hypothetical protein